MRLSDAIALGRVTVPKLTPGTLDGCALGMAANAVGCNHGDCYGTYDAIRRTWPWLNGKLYDPLTQRYSDAAEAIWRAFDLHVMIERSWTLDQLIDWVRSVEPAEPPAPRLTEGANSPADARTERVAGEAKGVGV